jgi:hypothetical protein
MPPTLKSKKTTLKNLSTKGVTKTVEFKVRGERAQEKKKKEDEEEKSLKSMQNLRQKVGTTVDIFLQIEALDNWYKQHSSATNAEQYEEERAELLQELKKVK